MANPMQRRSKNSFLLGVLITAILMGLIVAFLIMKIDGLNKEKKEMEAKQKSVYVANQDINSGDEVNTSNVMFKKVQTDLITGMITSLDADENGEPIIYRTKIDVPAGTIITEDMLYTEEDETTNDQRIQEYNMISLPSQLLEGSYIDIRLRLSSGEDYVVVSKKKVEKANATTIWIKVDETEILTLNNAIVEAWMMKGSKLYAIEYTEPGLQEKAVSTYPVSKEILELIASNPNVIQEARNELYSRYNDAQQAQRNNRINGELSQYIDQRDELVESGTSQEIQNIQDARKEYVESLGIQ